MDKQHHSGLHSTNETVEAKWEQLQYYESSQWQNSSNSPTNTEGAFSSIASSGASSTASSSSSSKTEGIYFCTSVWDGTKHVKLGSRLLFLLD